MIVIDSLDTPLPKTESPISLTIGSFDGVHLGHQAIIRELQGTKIVVTFSNHPSEVLNPAKNVTRICSNAEKIALLEKFGIDYLYLIPFTREFSDQTPEDFLERLQRVVPFHLLVLGADAFIGKNRSGTPEVVRKLAQDLGFEVLYVKDVEINGQRPSSSLIRRLIKEDKIAEAEQLLGRPL